MYMGVILAFVFPYLDNDSAPHVYGGDPSQFYKDQQMMECSPCIWG